MRIAIHNSYDVVIGFMDNSLTEALHFYDDTLHNYLKGTASTFEFACSSKHEDSLKLVVGNKLSFTYRNRKYYFNIVTATPNEYTVEVMAYATSLSLTNQYIPAYIAPAQMFLVEYLEIFDELSAGHSFMDNIEVGINEVSGKQIKAEWEGDSTILERLFSLANKFDAEIELVPVMNNRKYEKLRLNIYHKHSDKYQGIGRDTGVKLRYGREITGIEKESSIVNLYTAIKPIGKDGITIASVEREIYDEEGNLEYVTYQNDPWIYAIQARDRFPSSVKKGTFEQYIGYNWSYDTESIEMLFGQALSELKKHCQPEVTYRVDGYVDADIGDTFSIIDNEFNPPIAIRARVTEQEISLTDKTRAKTTFDNIEEIQRSNLYDQLKNLIEQRKNYVSAISSTNGLVFKNGEGQTTLEGVVIDGSNVVSGLTYKWYLDGKEVQ